jgi:hypothetical protein
VSNVNGGGGGGAASSTLSGTSTGSYVYGVNSNATGGGGISGVGNGGTGGSAKASASATASGSNSASAASYTTGGTGGNASGAGLVAGTGGTATGTTASASSGSGQVNVLASQAGGSGGTGGNGANGGAGTSSALYNAVSGLTSGILYATQNAYGGNGGYSYTGTAGKGAAATSTLGSSAKPYTDSGASYLQVGLTADGGNGGGTSSGVEGAGGTAAATLYLTSTATESPSVIGSATANGGTGMTPGAASAIATVAGTQSIDSEIKATATATSLAGSLGAGATATATTSSIGSVTGVATATTTGATGNATANSTAANALTGATDTVLANATAPTGTGTVSTLTEANIGGNWFGNPVNTSNGYAAYGFGMGLPTASVQVNDLTSPTLNPVVYNSLAASGSSIFGAGVLGANYLGATGSRTYTASNTQEYSLSGSNAFTLGLLSLGAYGSGFSSLSFTVTEGTSTLLSKSFTSLSTAETYFTDDPVSLGDLSGAVALKLTFKLTASTAEGAGISYLVADAPVTDAVHGRSRGFGVPAVLWTLNAAGDVGTRARLLLPMPRRIGIAALVKGQRR